MSDHEDSTLKLERTLLGESQVMRELLRAIRSLAPTESPVLLRGETGTGKTVIAQAIHELSLRRERRLADIHARAGTREFFGRDLFGVAREASPIPEMKGLFERAAGGTVLIEEIGELPDEFQAEVLRVIRSGCVRRVGSDREIPVSFRLLCTTQGDLREEVAAGRFREDLYSAVAEKELTIPALRDRVSDIRIIAKRVMMDQADRWCAYGLEREVKFLSPEALRVLERHSWPGNVRELMSAVVRAMVLSETAIIGPGDITFGPLEFVDEPRATFGASGGCWN